MEQNPLAMETLILCYIESKNLLRTKQLDQGGFNKLLIKSCEGFNYSDEEILSTWRNLVRQYLQVKNDSLEKESWKYYKIMDSCYEVSDFHQCGQSKFSDEMVWFLIECLLKRRNILKRSHNLERMIEVYHKFLEEGYDILLLNDIQTKWRYLNYRYSKLEGIKEAHLKMPYFTAIDGFRTGKKCVKINFTKSLTEILIRKFTEKKVMCNFHGYDSPQLLSEIQTEFQNLESNVGFDFSCKEIKDKWDKLNYVYEFLKKKHKTESQWMYFQAMTEHFGDNVENEVKPLNEKKYKSSNKNKKSKLTVIDQSDERSMSPLDTEKGEKFEYFNSIASNKTQKVDNKNIKEKSHENRGMKSLNNTKHVSKKRPKSVGEPNKNKKLKTTVTDRFDERNIVPLNADKGEKFGSFLDSIVSIKTEKKELENISDENISNVSENPPKSNDTSKKKQIFEIKEPKQNYNGDISCGQNNPHQLDKPFRSKKIGNRSNENISSSPVDNEMVDEYPKTKKKLKFDEMKDNCTSDFPNISLEEHSPYVNDLADNIENLEQINSSKLLTSQKNKVYINNRESNMDDNNGNITINLPTITKTNSGIEYLPSSQDVHIEYVEQVNSSESVPFGKNEVHIINESSIDKDNCNTTINLPSITKKFSGNEFLPLKKRLRLNEDELSLTKEIKDGFRGFSIMDQILAQSWAQAKDYIQWSEEETPAEVITDVPVTEDITDVPVTEDMTDVPVTEDMTDVSVTEDITDIPKTEDTNNINYTFEEKYGPEESLVSHSSQSHNNVSPPSVVSPKADDNSIPEQNFHSNDLLPEPVLSFVNKVEEINSSVEGGTSCELNNGLGKERNEEIEGGGNSDGVDNINDLHHIADQEYGDTFLKEIVSTELIETSIVDETITEMEIRSSEYYQKPEMPIQHSYLQCVESEVSRENGIFVEEETNLPTKSMEFSDGTFDTSVNCATVDTNYESPNNEEYHTKLFDSTINQQCQTEFQNYVEQTKCNSTSSCPDIPEGYEVANLQRHELNLSPPSQCNLNRTGATDTVENVKTEMKSVRLPVTCGGKLKEIFISPRELSKIAKMKPNSVKQSKNPLMTANGEKCISKNNCKNIKFMSQVIKEANVIFSKNNNLTKDKSNETLINSSIIPPVPKVSSSTGILDLNQQSPNYPDREFDGISIVSSMMDDEQLSDDLLADVIDDFQEQSSQELKDIKNLVIENNLLQRETNKVLRQILEKL